MQFMIVKASRGIRFGERRAALSDAMVKVPEHTGLVEFQGLGIEDAEGVTMFGGEKPVRLAAKDIVSITRLE